MQERKQKICKITNMFVCVCVWSSYLVAWHSVSVFLCESQPVFIPFAATMLQRALRCPAWWTPWSTHPALGLVACLEIRYRKCEEQLQQKVVVVLLFVQRITVKCASVPFKPSAVKDPITEKAELGVCSRADRNRWNYASGWASTLWSGVCFLGWNVSAS